jgi:hypothetical protein
MYPKKEYIPPRTGTFGIGDRKYINARCACPLVLKEPQMHRFYRSAIINKRRIGRDAPQIMDEVVKYLVNQKGAKVKGTFEIQVELPDGAPNDVVRTVKENCKTLLFEAFGFEQD